ncbi:MAG: PQQ-binding-like beta-propeller repeat protein [Thermoplasmatales archaeon]|nr:MAG: PQQ-binding-like beta-propeller repeat protein [Thermoplasmatales archaeon]
MIRLASLVIVGIILFTIFIPTATIADDDYKSKVFTTGKYEKGYRYNIQGWVYVHIEGEPYERGYQYGYLASAEIMDIFQRWINLEYENIRILKIFKFRSPEKLWDFFKLKAKNRFLKYVPFENQEELRGLTDGLRAKDVKIFNRIIEFDDLLAFQFIQDIDYSSFRYSKKGFQPFRRIIFNFRQLLTKGDDESHSGHCTAFIATGDATSNGNIIVAHSSIFPHYVSERCNFILDVQPSKGNRFLMTCPPGSLWSQEDWYQNEKGIILTETELYPQGFWKKRGIPKGVRSRTAIQYSDNIDDVIELLLKNNNGLIPNEWLIGDTKSGEIASIQLALFNKPIKRTFNGFYWSCSIPHDINVFAELWGIPPFIFKIISRRLPQVLTTDVAEKFTELGEEYYGQIDTNIAKKIMSTHPIYIDTTDCKITSSTLMEQMGLFVFMGRPDGEQWNPSNEEKEDYFGITELPTSGWLEVYPPKSAPIYINSIDSYKEEKKSKVLWKYETEDAKNMEYSTTCVSEDMIFTTTSEGGILNLNTNSGTLNWKDKLNGKIVESVAFEDLLFVGGENGLYAYDKETGKIKWKQFVGYISCKPIIAENLVIAGCENGNLYAFDVNSGKISWTKNFLSSITISEISKDKIYIGSGDSCYALNMKNNDILWTFKTNGKISTPPRVYNNDVYIGSWDGNLYALDSRNGNLKWTFKTGWGIVTTPAVSNNMIFVASNDNNFYAIDNRNGNLEWHFSCKSAIHSNPVVYGDYVFFGSDDGRFYALEKTNGDLAWSFTPGYFIKDDALNYLTTPILSDPYVEDGVLYISAKGTIYALDAQTFEKEGKISAYSSSNLINIIIIFVLLFIVVTLISIKIRKKQKKR